MVKRAAHREAGAAEVAWRGVKRKDKGDRGAHEVGVGEVEGRELHDLGASAGALDAGRKRWRLGHGDAVHGDVDLGHAAVVVCDRTGERGRGRTRTRAGRKGDGGRECRFRNKTEDTIGYLQVLNSILYTFCWHLGLSRGASTVEDSVKLRRFVVSVSSSMMMEGIQVSWQLQ